jgi:predicted nucleotidyltransferase
MVERSSNDDTLIVALQRAFGNVSSGIVSAYLHGSHARRRAHRESDVDVGVLLCRERFPTPRDRFEARVQLTSAVGAELHRNDVDLVILNDCPPHLGRRIATDGQRVYCADPATDHAFRRDVQLRAADLEPFLRRMRAVKLGVIAP